MKQKSKSTLKLSKINRYKTKSPKKRIISQKSSHPWRLCPYGEHWVKTHEMHVPPSKTHPDGTITSRHEHCARNPSGKDQLYPDEIQEITLQYFSSIKNKPCDYDKEFGKKANKYDDLIEGWTNYWNKIFKPKFPLTSNIVKALIATESSFTADKLANKKKQK